MQRRKFSAAEHRAASYRLMRGDGESIFIDDGAQKVARKIDAERENKVTGALSSG